MMIGFIELGHMSCAIAANHSQDHNTSKS